MNEKKNLGLGKKIAIGIGILFVLIIIAGIASLPSSSSTNPQQNTLPVEQNAIVEETTSQEPIKSNEFAIGDRVSIDDNVYVINQIFTTPAIGSDYVNKMADGIFVVVEISIENGGDSATMVSPERFQIIDSQNRQYGWSSDYIYLSSMGLEPLPLLKELGPGLKTSGYVAFDIPADDRGLVLEISETFSGKKYVKIGDVESI
ncbi:DUF4352 domain-containing protein [Candidatus Nitrosotenuis sp. DW1]|uniref:DUF4352 domain-containing protein n=1 Tax=Candidatus Nitrosotenuis sp. DW1 TaxID=2259672 RepID=UPI0015CB927F|nr:DUF4352 domain-containing protein [Candidatus Nitrosotenuis sp. DW1]QLH08558.1 hypothetical protein DSQ19_02880 [Candidatus Nitrosotenuis sp. DW1]